MRTPSTHSPRKLGPRAWTDLGSVLFFPARRFGLRVLTVLGLLVPSLASADVIINEVLYDTAGISEQEFIELVGPPGQSLNGYRVVSYYASGFVHDTFFFPGSIIPLDGYFVFGDAGVPNVDRVESISLLNGPAELRLYYGNELLDSVCYGTSEDLVCEGTPAEDVPEDYSIARCPDGIDTDDNAEDFEADFTPTPGLMNDLPCDAPPVPRSVCEMSAEDADGVAVLLGEFIVVHGIVISVSRGYNGLPIDFQITDGECCGWVRTSGYSVPDVQEGDEVEVQGSVSFFNGETRLFGPRLEVTVLSIGNPVPEPPLITTGELGGSGGDYEACLVRIECADLVDPGEWPSGGETAYVTIDDGSGPAYLYILATTDIDGSIAPVDRFSVLGVVGQRDTEPPYDDGYRLVPRSLEDLVYSDPICGPPDSGACCVSDSVCVVLVESDCQSQGGFYQGDDSVCEAVLCTDDGACCLDSECSCCVWADWSYCDRLGGLFQGPGTQCYATLTCVSSACCLPDGTCIEELEEVCIAEGWLVTGDSTCDPNPCEVVSGVAPDDTSTILWLARPMPSPVNDGTTLQFRLGEPARVDLGVYDVSGKLVDQVASEAYSAGAHFIEWSAVELPSGRYFLELRAGSEVEVRSFVVLH
ncbi:MAG: T9SS type A sorting domain-containing protein [Candidatus Eisenbacteria bacterium]|uniref:T9SS type A sorting domain-containing protein n=1 Tax=Eiseniibacteriota bacterium TaxID=2212470 RepID=A0A956SHF1_UNCEI|nr:T9SS type A sorting domain-containing protein [Candidatus Eisenbacteria bacterium]